MGDVSANQTMFSEVVDHVATEAARLRFVIKYSDGVTVQCETLDEFNRAAEVMFDFKRTIIASYYGIPVPPCPKWSNISERMEREKTGSR